MSFRSRHLVIPFLVSFLLAGCAGLARVVYPLNEDAGRVQPGSYRLDPDHASVLFSVNHLGFSTFYGRFNRLEGVLNLDQDQPEASDVAVTIDAASIDTHVALLDDELRSSSVFDVEKFPVIRFTSTAVRRTGAASADIDGVLEMHGVALPVTLKAEFEGSGANPLNGAETVGFKASASLTRSEYGLGKWVPLVGDIVTVTIAVEFVREG